MKLIKNEGISQQKKILIFFSSLFGFIGTFTIVLYKSSLKQDVFQALNIQFFSVSNLFIFMFLFVLFYGGLQNIEKFIVKGDIKKSFIDTKYTKKVFYKSFILNIVFWGIWFLVYFPGCGMNDTINCIASPHDDIQPIVYQLIIYYGMQIFAKITSNMTISYAILVLIQMIVMSMVVAWNAKWLFEKGLKPLYLNLFILYYALMPAIADYSITLVKDTLFGLFMMSLIPFLYDLIEKNGTPIRNRKFLILFLFILFGISALRPNGKIIVLVLIILLLKSKMYNKKYILFVLGIIVIFNCGITICEKELKTTDVSFRESIGVPLTQIGAVLNVDGYISEEDKQVLNNILPVEEWKAAYRFSFVDTIKFHEKFNQEWLNENKGEFLKTWFSILKDNFSIYVKAYICHTYGFWNCSPLNISSTDFSQSYFTRINNNTSEDSFWGEFCSKHGLRNRDILFDSISRQLDIIFQSFFNINLILGPGILFWISISFMMFLFLHKKYQICIVFAPTILSWVTMMIATPASFIYRYSFYLVVSLPILIILTLFQIGGKSKE